ncbi:LOW QUALITY PROTEIN: cell death-inducing p53-target protein 1-like [Lampetra planeri]
MASEPPPPYQEPYPVGPSVPTAPSATPTPKGPPGMTGPLLGDTKSMPQPGQDGQFPVQTQPSWFPALPPYSATPPTMGPPQQGYPTSPGEYGPAFYPPQPVCPYPAYGQPLAAGGPGGPAGPTMVVPSAAGQAVTLLHSEVPQPYPMRMVCPHCQLLVTTQTSHVSGTMSVLMCVLCCIVGCDLGCCLIPFLVDDLKDVEHTCPNCKAHLFMYKRL